MKKNNWPVTLEDAVKQTLSMLSAKDKKHIAKMPEEKTILLHMSLGMQIRNSFGLHQGNEALMIACGNPFDPDEVSGIIIEAVWKKLKAGKGK